MSALAGDEARRARNRRFLFYQLRIINLAVGVVQCNSVVWTTIREDKLLSFAVVANSPDQPKRLAESMKSVQVFSFSPNSSPPNQLPNPFVARTSRACRNSCRSECLPSSQFFSSCP
jgi:hypothetical protein